MPMSGWRAFYPQYDNGKVKDLQPSVQLGEGADMATVVFTMRDGSARTVEGVTLSQASHAWWHWAQFQDRDDPEARMLGPGSDIREVEGVVVHGTQEERDGNPRVNVGNMVIVAP